MACIGVGELLLNELSKVRSVRRVLASIVGAKATTGLAAQQNTRVKARLDKTRFAHGPINDDSAYGAGNRGRERGKLFIQIGLLIGKKEKKNCGRLWEACNRQFS